MPMSTKPLDLAEYLVDPTDQAELLSDAVASGDPAYLTHALGIIARARCMSDTAVKRPG